MRDAVTNLIKNYDITGRYLDRNAIDSLKSYFDTGAARIAAAGVINANAAAIVKQASLQLFDELPELIRPGGNAYTTRRYAACLRDLDYYLRYARRTQMGTSHSCQSPVNCHSPADDSLSLQRSLSYGYRGSPSRSRVNYWYFCAPYLCPATRNTASKL